MRQHETNHKLKIVLLILAGVVCAAIVMAAPARDLALGRESFEKRCGGCHTLDTTKVGPALRGVFGRRSGKDPKFAYSEALKKAPVTWDEPTLDRWLTDTESVVADNDMAFRLNDRVERENIIAYLRQLSNK